MSVLSVCICMHHMGTVTLEARESIRSSETGVRCCPVGSGNPIQVVYKSRQCSQPLDDLSSSTATHLIVVRIKMDFSSFLCPT